MSPILIVSAILAALAYAAHQVASREPSLPTAPVPVSLRDANVGTEIRVTARVVGPVDGTWIEAPLAGRCVAWWTRSSDGEKPRAASVDFLVEDGGVRARVTGRLELDGPSRSIEETNEGGPARRRLERAIRPGATVTIFAFASAREPDSVLRAPGGTYRDVAVAQRLVLTGGREPVRVVEHTPASSTPPTDLVI